MTEDDVSADDLTADVVSVAASEYANARLETPYLCGDMLDRPPQDFGVAIHKDGANIALTAGTLNDDDDDQLYVYTTLTPKQAREIGGALLQCAERAENILEDADDDAVEQDAESFVRRLLP
jgi:hypothetical protein